MLGVPIFAQSLLFILKPQDTHIADIGKPHTNTVDGMCRFYNIDTYILIRDKRTPKNLIILVIYPTNPFNYCHGLLVRDRYISTHVRFVRRMR